VALLAAFIGSWTFLQAIHNIVEHKPWAIWGFLTSLMAVIVLFGLGAIIPGAHA
jgi:hypothetical protein